MRRFAPLLVALALAGCGGAEEADLALVQPTDGSWIRGQAALSESAAFLAIASRAQLLADRRAADRERLIVLIRARKEARDKRRREAAMRRYRRAKRLADIRYEALIREADARRARLEAERRRALRQARRERRELLEKLKVEPGSECSIPEIRAQFDCVSGRLPTG
jgi:hypothetical protein